MQQQQTLHKNCTLMLLRTGMTSTTESSEGPNREGFSGNGTPGRKTTGGWNHEQRIHCGFGGT
jgi:hypothetical protein